MPAGQDHENVSIYPFDDQQIDQLMTDARECVLMWATQAPIWGWAIASILLGLGFTFFSGATEAWLVDALVRECPPCMRRA